MTKGKRLWLVLLANVSMVLALVIVGLISRSLGVLAAGGDYLGDAAGVALALIALRYSRHGTENPHASSLPALANGTFLLETHKRKLAEYEAQLAECRQVDIPSGIVLAIEAGMGHKREYVRFWSKLLGG